MSEGHVATARRVLDELVSTDTVAHGVTIDVLEGLEKYRWMLAPHRS